MNGQSAIDPIDPNSLVQWVLREAYEETTEDLRFYADRVRLSNAQRKVLLAYARKPSDERAREATAQLVRETFAGPDDTLLPTIYTLVEVVATAPQRARDAAERLAEILRAVDETDKERLREAIRHIS